MGRRVDIGAPELMLGGALVAAAALTWNFFSGSGGSVQPTGTDPGSSGLTSDWATADLEKLISFGNALQLTDPTIPLRVWANESDNKATAHNPNGDASGLFQLMPSTAAGLGWDTSSDPTLANFRALSVSDQLDWALRYYAPHAGQLNSVARFYVANFLPALLSDADNPSFNLTGALGSQGDAVYSANSSFDTAGKGYITPADLVAASVRATGPRTNELIGRLQALLGVA